MELNFAEINKTENLPNELDYNSYENNDVNYEKYWEKQSQQKENVQRKKKKVTFTDILSNMNIVVNTKGVLQFMTPVNNNDTQYLQGQQQQEQYPQQYPQQQYPQQQYPQQQKSMEPLDSSVKHSYIYNKYFKDYKDANTPKIEVKVPKTKEEYIQMLLEEKQRQIEERRRIAQIKSKKLMFTANYNVNYNNPGNIKASKNNLRKMSFN